MKRPRLVISDVDGTLVRSDKSLSQGVVAAVGRLRAAGVPFTIISARPPGGMRWLVERLGLSSAIGAFNGGTIVTPEGTIVSADRIEPAAAAHALALLDRPGITPWVYGDGLWYVRTLDNAHVAREVRAANTLPVIVGSFDGLLGHVDKIVGVSEDHELLARIEPEVARAIGSAANVARSQAYYLDLTAPSGNKGDGIAALARALGIDLTDTVVFGDQHNDLPMFARAALAVAMGNAPEDVKAQAAHVSRSNDEDGVAEAIDRFVLPLLKEAPVKRMIAFDLDGTLAESKQPLGTPMAEALADLLGVAQVAVISGGDWPQFEKQVVSRLPARADLARLFIMPTTGTKLYRFDGSTWKPVYADVFDEGERKKIVEEIGKAEQAEGLDEAKTWGDKIEDRGSQITFSGLGQEAPLDAKKAWDPDFAKRKKLQAALQKALPDLSINVGGSTSIDITRKGVDKAYGMRRLCEHADLSFSDILFMGDAIYPGGNDNPVPEAGIDSIKVRDVEETLTAIRTVIACLKT